MDWVGDGGGSHKITMKQEDYFCLLLVSYCNYPGTAQHTARVFAVMLCKHPYSMASTRSYVQCAVLDIDKKNYGTDLCVHYILVTFKCLMIQRLT